MALKNTTADANEFMTNGFHIIGIWPMAKAKTNGAMETEGYVCGCGNADCAIAGKHPVASNWQHAVDWSDEQLETMNTMGHFKTGYGVLMKGLLVIDVDARNGGVESYAKMLEDFPEIAGAGLIVETGSGGGSKHLYFRNTSNKALVQQLPQYKGIDLKSTGFAVGPGSLHKSGKRYKCVYGDPSEISDAPPALIEALTKPERYRVEFNSAVVDVAAEEIARILSFVSPDCGYEEWISCGMAVHHATQGAGFAIWEAWSAKSKKYPGTNKLERHWHSFGKSATPRGIGTLIHFAQQNGYQIPVAFESDAVFEFNEEHFEATHETPFDVSGVDLLRPPGLVGQVAGWINSNSRHLRERLSVIAALTAVGNVIGLRYIDGRDGVTANLFSFCVAGSATGKENIGQCFAEIHRATGLHPALYGAIKSEQEIIRNLVRHQTCFYSIDEFGMFYAKLANAQKRGGANYLEGVLGIIMSVYSKANGFFLINGDLKEELRKLLRQEHAGIMKEIDGGHDKEGRRKLRADYIETALRKIDDGIEKPFLSLMGYAVPENFDVCVNAETARNGFIGRSIVVREHETNPRRNVTFTGKIELPIRLQMQLAQLAHGDSATIMGDSRLENYAPRHAVPTDESASKMLDYVSEWLEDYAEAQKEITGFEAIVRRTYEMISKISFILACGEGLRTKEHVRWASAYCINDMRMKITAASSQDSAGRLGSHVLRDKIIKHMDEDEGISVAVLCNKLRPSREADIKACLEAMVKARICRQKLLKPARGKATEKYYLCKATTLDSVLDRGVM